MTYNDYGWSPSPPWAEGDSRWYTVPDTTYTTKITLGDLNKKLVEQHKEKNTMTTEAAVAKARAEANEKRAKRLIADIEREIGQFAPLRAGTFITAKVEYADSGKVYRYAWIKGDKSWYRTYSTRVMTTEQVVDELVQLVLDAQSVEWEIVGAGE